MARGGISETRLMFLVGAVQFVNVLDFMMVMPMGPDFAKGLGIPTSMLGLVGGSYTAAAAVSGLVGAAVLDRFDRRKALAFTLFGLVIGTAAGGFATGLGSLIAARVIAGAFGGPATSVSLAIIADVIPPERRGRAMGAVMGAFSVASTFGVPAGLELARLGGWQLPFFATAALGAVIAASSVLLMPPLAGHLSAKRQLDESPLEIVRRPMALLALATVAAAMMGNFALIPNLSAYWQFNRGFPREDLWMLYLIGGCITFVTLRISGQLVDRLGPSRVAGFGTLLYVVTLYTGFIDPILAIPITFTGVAFMVTGTFRMVPMQALSTRVPEPAERARFMSAQSAVQHLSSAAGSMLAAQFLREREGGALEGIEQVAWFSTALALAVPVLIWLVERRVQKRDAQRAHPRTAAPHASAPPLEASS